MNGIVDIPVEIESASAQTLSPNSNATANIVNKELIIGVPKGRDAINPFKGWYNSSNDFPQTGQNGDYLYLIGANASDPAAIYAWNGSNWADTGRTADTSNVQTFASGEELNEVRIDNKLKNSSEFDVAGAKISTIMNEKLRGINLEETQAYYPSDKDNLQIGFINGYTGEFDNQSQGYQYFRVIDISVENYDSIRFLGVDRTGELYPGYAIGYYDDENVWHPTRYWRYSGKTETKLTDLYVDVRVNETTIRITCKVYDTPLNEDVFYAYLQTGQNVLQTIDNEIKSNITLDEYNVTRYDMDEQNENSKRYSFQQYSLLKTYMYGTVPSFCHIRVPVEQGDYIKIKAAFDVHNIMFLTTFANPVSGEPIAAVSDSFSSIKGSKEFLIQVPEGAKAFAVNIGNNSDYPEYIEVYHKGGYEVPELISAGKYDWNNGIIVVGNYQANVLMCHRNSRYVIKVTSDGNILRSIDKIDRLPSPSSSFTGNERIQIEHIVDTIYGTNVMIENYEGIVPDFNEIQ